MENILDLSIILPIKTNLVKDFAELFGKSIESIQLQQWVPRRSHHHYHQVVMEMINYPDDYGNGDKGDAMMMTRRMKRINES